MIKFSIGDWFYWGEVFCDGKQKTPIANHVPDLSNIAPIQRRRLPQVAKRINQFALKAKQQKIPLIYVSAHGEISRTLSIIRSFTSDVSPMQFSLSVHNAIAGLLSVAHGNRQSYQALDSLSGGIETAIVEAKGLLMQHEKVAIVYYDEALPDEYQDLYDSQPMPTTRVFAMMISRGEDFFIDGQENASSSYQLASDYANLPLIVDFIQTDKQSTLLSRYASCAWLWGRV